MPANGDVNPYGIANVPSSVGSLVRGDILISNFNSSENLQGTGTTIVQESPTGHLSLFAQIDPSTLPGPCPGGVGLTTALAILPGGYVVVGSLPTTDGSAATAQAGCLIVLNSMGHVVKTISGGPINGPWDMTAVSNGPFSTLFVTNVLNGTVAHGETPTDEGTVVRIGLVSLFGARAGRHVRARDRRRLPGAHRPRSGARGRPDRRLRSAMEGTLYVADTLDNRIAAVPGAMFRQTPIAGGGITVAKGGYLNSPLGLTMAPNGDVLTANGGDGNLVETTPLGAEFQPFDNGSWRRRAVRAGGGAEPAGRATSSTTRTTRSICCTERSRSAMGACRRRPATGPACCGYSPVGER